MSLSLKHWASVFLLASPVAVAIGTSKVCSNPLESCGSSTSTDTCCYNSPGGQFAATQFWDTSPSTGPSNSWTVHGLWPDHCDGTYDSSCDTSRAYTGIGSILTSLGKSSLLSYMNTYWKDVNGDDESFWEHEWGKHGTCVSTLNPSCYSGYTSKQEVGDYFQKAVDIFKTRDTYGALTAAGITPSSTKTYTSAAIQAALKAAFGVTAIIQCDSGALNEVWYSFYVKGSVATGTFVAVNPVGQTGSCASTGIKWLPKSGSSPAPTNAPTTTGGSNPQPTSGGSISGSGYLNAITGGSQTGCLISAGTWYTTGTCATFTAAASGSGVTLSTSKGACGIVSGAFTCGTGVASTVFTSSSGYLAYSGSTSFYATSVPSGSTQATVYTTSKAVSVKLAWLNK